jgi:hypothetical protein
VFPFPLAFASDSDDLSYKPAVGTLNKVKISSKGAIQVHRDMKLSQATTLGVSMSLNALDTSQVPDIGISFDHSP